MRFAKLGLICWMALLAACGAPAAALPTRAPTLPSPAVSTQVPANSVIVTETAPPQEAASPAPPTVAQTESKPLLSGQFFKQEVAVTGSYTLDPTTGVLRLSDDFNLSQGPDLFVILSGASEVTLDYVSFSGVVNNSPLLYLGALASASGSQEYAIPAGTDLSVYKSVVVWCRQFSVAFAAALLTP
ncbi:MAG: DM13 domain-containing protein [Chloroflexi bacterium]|nr:DM13 domain-containing protein [Chloroflexota bacterium]